MRKVLFTLTAFTALTLQSCKQEGCTDKNAVNYSEDADKDDGTCKYSGEVVLWYGEDVANALSAVGATSLTYYVDGALVGSSAANIYWTAAPTCGQNASITVTKDLGMVKSKSFSYRVIDQNNNILWDGTLNVDANTCIKFQLTI